MAPAAAVGGEVSRKTLPKEDVGAGTLRDERDAKTDRRTLFVRNLPYTANEAQLEEAFSDVGPGRSSTEALAFALVEDAERAVKEKQGFKLQGRALRVELAQKRAPLNERKAKQQHAVSVAAAGEDAPNKAASEQQESAATPVAQAQQQEVKRKRADANDVSGKNAKAQKKQETVRSGEPSLKQRSARTVALGGIDSDAAFEAALKVAKKSGTVEDVIRPIAAEDFTKHGLQRDGCLGGTALLRYTAVSAARAAVAALHGKQLQGCTVWARQLGGEGAHLKQLRLILRNLPFQVKSAELQELCSAVGFVWDLKVPVEANGRGKGFAFVTYTSKSDAIKAIAELNGRLVQKRPIAVDWALAKSKFELVVAAAEPSKAEPEDRLQVDDGASTASEESDVSDVARDREAGQGAIEHSGDEDIDAADSEPDEHNEDGVARAADEEAVYQKALAEVLGPSQPITEAKMVKAAKPALTKPTPAPDVPPVTVFVRNIPIDATPEAVRQSLAAFGKIRSCRLVKNKSTGRNKGTAFVDFQDQKAADKAVAAAEGKRVLIHGQPLLVHLAVDKDRAKAIAVAASETGKGGEKRNLHLAKEGSIPQGSPAAQGMSKSDFAKRKRLEAEKTTKLRSPNFFVSQTRLSVHNVPSSMDDKKLKTMFISAVKERATKQTPVIKQVKILRDRDKIGADGLGRAKGSAFVEFTEHEHALVALRALNNNPGPWGNEHRPIVEFAIENAQILKVRKDRLDNRKQGNSKKHEGGSQGHPSSQQHEQSPQNKPGPSQHKQASTQETPSGQKAEANGTAKHGNKRKRQESDGGSSRKKVQKAEGRKVKEMLKPVDGRQNGSGGALSNPKRNTRAASSIAAFPPAVQKVSEVHGSRVDKDRNGKNKGQRVKSSRAKPAPEEDKHEKLVAQYRKKYFERPATPQVQAQGSVRTRLSRWFE
eukprot:jgi/Chlat1/7746/Chrsp66S07326